MGQAEAFTPKHFNVTAETDNGRQKGVRVD